MIKLKHWGRVEFCIIRYIPEWATHDLQKGWAGYRIADIWVHTAVVFGSGKNLCTVVDIWTSEGRGEEHGRVLSWSLPLTDKDHQRPLGPSQALGKRRGAVKTSVRLPPASVRSALPDNLPIATFFELVLDAGGRRFGNPYTYPTRTVNLKLSENFGDHECYGLTHQLTSAFPENNDWARPAHWGSPTWRGKNY